MVSSHTASPKVPFGASQAPKSPSATPSNAPSSPLSETPKSPQFAGDQFQTSKTSKTPRAAAPRFGGNPPPAPAKTEPGGFRKGIGFLLGIGSVVGFAAAIPLGLTQMFFGLFVHPLLITGALTLAAPFIGLFAAHKLRHK